LKISFLAFQVATTRYGKDQLATPSSFAAPAAGQHFEALFMHFRSPCLLSLALLASLRECVCWPSLHLAFTGAENGEKGGQRSMRNMSLAAKRGIQIVGTRTRGSAICGAVPGYYCCYAPGCRTKVQGQP